MISSLMEQPPSHHQLRAYFPQNEATGYHQLLGVGTRRFNRDIESLIILFPCLDS